MSKFVNHTDTGRTRLELLSIHHFAPLAEWFSFPARVAIMLRGPDGFDDWSRPGPSLRLACCAGTCSPGRVVAILS